MSGRHRELEDSRPWFHRGPFAFLVSFAATAAVVGGVLTGSAFSITSPSESSVPAAPQVAPERPAVVQEVGQ